MDIKEIALKVWYSKNECIPADGMIKLTEFAQDLVAEIQRVSEPVACNACVGSIAHVNYGLPIGTKLFAFPPSIEALEDKVAEATRSVGRYCLSEDDCIANGINFAAYERGVNDAASAIERKFRKGE